MRYLSEDFGLRLWTDLIFHGEGFRNKQEEIHKNRVKDDGRSSLSACGCEISSGILVLSTPTADDYSCDRDDDHYDPCAGSPSAKAGRST